MGSEYGGRLQVTLGEDKAIWEALSNLMVELESNGAEGYKVEGVTP